MSELRELSRETEAAKALLANVRDILGDDEQAVADAIEGETNLKEAIASTTQRWLEVRSFAAGLAQTIKDLQSRLHRYETQDELLRAALLSAMAAGEMKKLELAAATLSRKPTPPCVTVLEEADIPSQFWKAQPPKLDKRALLDALKAKETVPGATLSNGGETIAIRVA